ncbi:collagen alpha-6(VI) chain-like [Conger conger]|uniref:collagen alpha-6(VI) chain-like n=1 Tax=Conger conger TaxID=82655 RepID=UPI002A5ABE62|nr:collagen alpha-6(VI) chain-like [Conger conger]
MGATRVLVAVLTLVSCFFSCGAQKTECIKATTADIVFLVDGSSSIAHDQFKKMKHFLHTFVDGLDIGIHKVRIGLAQFSNDPHQEFLLGEHMEKKALLEQIDNLIHRGGGTKTGKALRFLQSTYFTEAGGSRASENVPQITVVITDGSSSDEVEVPAQELRKHGVIIFAIGIGEANEEELQKIANSPHKHFVISIDNYNTLQKLTRSFKRTVCATVEALIQDPKSADVVILVDSTADIGKVKNLLNRLVSQLNVGSEAHRIGLAQFGSDSQEEFRLNRYQTKDEVQLHLRNKFRLRPGRDRHLGKALEHARVTFFNTDAGSRIAEGFQQFLVVITAGESEDNMERAAESIKSDGVTVISIGLPKSNREELELMASSHYVFQIPSQNIVGISQEIKSIIESEKADGLAAGPSDCRLAQMADIVFIVDQSTSKGFQLVRQFISLIVGGLDISSTKVRVGIVLYSDAAKAVIYLNSIKEKDDILQFIKMLPYQEGSTKTGAALDFTREYMFSKSTGSRKGVQQLAIVITDRKSQDDVSIASVALRRTGVTVYAIGGKDADPNELKQIASHPAREYVFKADSLLTLQTDLQKLLCHDIVQTAFVDPVTRFNLKTGCSQLEAADIYFLIDESGSIEEEPFKDMQKFIKEFLGTFTIGPDYVRVGVVKFADIPKLQFSLTVHTTSSSLETAVDNVPRDGGGTNIGKALTFMAPLFKEASESRGEKVREFLIVITDGNSSDSDPVKQPAKELRDQGITIYAIGVKDAIEDELLQIAGSQERKFFVNDFAALTSIKLEIVRDICSEAVCKDVEGDVLFLIDGSSSIRHTEFEKIGKFMQSLVDKTEIGSSKFHVGVLQFSNKSQEEFRLDNSYDKGRIKQAISSIRQLKGGTLTGQALSFSSQYFESPKGGRLNVRKFLIVITNGKAHDDVAKPAAKLRNSGVIIYSIGVLNANNTQLQEISGSRERIFPVKDFDSLQPLIKDFHYKLCHPEPDCKRTGVADIIFLVDGSTSISNVQFQSIIKFMTSVVNNTDVGENGTRFGTILYSNEAKSSFTLNQYYTKREVRTAIANLEPPTGDTYTAQGLKYSLDFFEPKHGGRGAEKIPQILMVITDGEATDPDDLPVWSTAVREKGINIYSIGVEGAKEEELEVMAGDPKKVSFVTSYEALEVLYKNLSNMLCGETKPVCDKKTDLVILMDGSNSIDPNDFTKMRDFVSKLAGRFRVSQESVRIGIAQFSDKQRGHFYLNQYDSITNDSIQAIDQITGEETLIGGALYFIRQFFQSSHGCRINQNVPQNLLVITDGDPHDGTRVEPEARVLRSMNINVLAIGVGNNITMQTLKNIAESDDRIFTVDQFDVMKKIEERLVETICDPPQKPEVCSVDIGIGFDMSQRAQSALQKFKAYFPDIVRYVSSLGELCCLEDKRIKPRIGFLVVEEDGRVIDDYKFELYNELVIQKVVALATSRTTFFNVQLLQAFSKKFQEQSRAGVKILIIFTDGFDVDIKKLEAESDRLRREGIQALLLVGLEGVRNPSDLQMVEFGRGFGYKQPLSIGMQNVASVMLEQIDTVAGRECCGVICECHGPVGAHGLRGSPGRKGEPSQNGHHGFPGEEGGIGERGPPGLNGTQGSQGCPGKRGIKGSAGYWGYRGEDGDHGLDGVHGEQGATGLPGVPGERGSPGSPGRSGIRGEHGDRGQPGLRGDPGRPGEDNTIPGRKGENGDSGIHGDEGKDGLPGENGIPGNKGAQGRRGLPGYQGEKGEPGELGLPGSPGPTGPQGERGLRGLSGQGGALGLPGSQGKPGPAGDEGLPGSRGPHGQKGQPGDVGGKGAVGPPGPRGMLGLDGRNGILLPGPKGKKGEPGFPGNPGHRGEDGTQGKNGGQGPKGNRGASGNSGRPGEHGEPGASGPPGHPGPRGSAGNRSMSDCQLVNYIREKCVCCLGRTECPVYPTELVIALDMSQDVTTQIFERMHEVVETLLGKVSIAESSCPTGARVAILSYSSNTKYLIRFSDYHRKHHLLEAVKSIPLERTSNRRNIGAAMRFVARNVFKRVRQGVLMRKVAVFITNGPSQDMISITTAVLEFKALDITAAVLAFREPPNVRRAFEADETRSFLLTVKRPEEQMPDLRQVQQCVICYDPCSPDEACGGINLVPVPLKLDIDLALMVDSSRNMQSDQYEGMRQLLGSVLEQIAISTQPNGPNNQARVALVQHSASSYPPREGQVPVKVEFDLLAYKGRNKMKTHVFQSMQQIGGASGLGHAIEWTIQNIMLKAGNPRKTKMVLAIVGGETSSWDRVKLDTIALQAKCQGVVVFILTVGDEFKVEEIASFPLEQHIVHLGHIKQGEQEYAQRFLRAFLQILKRGINTYPSATLQRQCEHIRMLNDQGEALEGQAVDRVLVPSIPVLEEGEEVDYIDQAKPQAAFTTTVAEEFESQPSPGRGDENGFSTRTGLCSQRQDIGSCHNYILKWYFDMERNECTQFWYSGCGGNDNRFETQEECEALCLTVQ